MIASMRVFCVCVVACGSACAFGGSAGVVGGAEIRLMRRGALSTEQQLLERERLLQSLAHARQLALERPEAMARTFGFKNPAVFQAWLEELPRLLSTSGLTRTGPLKDKTGVNALKRVQKYLTERFIPEPGSPKRKNPITSIHGSIAVEFEVFDLKGKVIDGKTVWEYLFLVVVLVAPGEEPGRLLVVADGRYKTHKGSASKSNYTKSIEGGKHHASFTRFLRVLVDELVDVITVENVAAALGKTR